MDLIETLMSFSLTRQEAVIYMTLLSEGALTGYEVSKFSGISRSNSYTSLANLVEKGAAYITEDTATRYTPVEISEFCKNKISELESQKEFLEKNMPVAKEEIEGYITIKGEKHITEKIINLICAARERIYISVSEVLLEQLIPYLAKAAEKGLKVVVITNTDVKILGATIYNAVRKQNQIRLIVDTSAVLTGEIANSSTCLYSKKKNLVDLFKDTLKNEIKLIELNQL